MAIQPGGGREIQQGLRLHPHPGGWDPGQNNKKELAAFGARQSGQGLTRIPAVAGYRAIDKYTVEISTKAPDATLPYQIAWIMMSSPAQWEKLNKSWDAFARTPSGTGPWK